MIKNFKFNPHYNIIGDYDLMIRISKKFKGMGFQNKFVNIRFHKDNFTHNNRKIFYYHINIVNLHGDYQSLCHLQHYLKF